MRENRTAVVLPGNYDGVHLGHQSLISRARALAGKAGHQTCVLTFSPHPAALLSPSRAPVALTGLERKVALLEGAGVDQVHVQPFDEAFAQIEANAFASDFLAEKLQAMAVVVGHDFRYGRGRRGHVETLQAAGLKFGFVVHQVEPVLQNALPISSSRIRATLTRGDVSSASRMLGRYHELSGTVAEGDRRGRQLGFPTANLHDVSGLIPQRGVYAVWAKVMGAASGAVAGVMNVGARPTFNAGESTEVHLLDFEGDLYGKQLRVAILLRLRGEVAFTSVDALKEQIKADISKARSAHEAACADFLRVNFGV